MPRWWDQWPTSRLTKSATAPELKISCLTESQHDRSRKTTDIYCTSHRHRSFRITRVNVTDGRACRAEFMKQVLPRLLRPQRPARELSRRPTTLTFDSHEPSRKLLLEYELTEEMSFLLDEFSPNSLQFLRHYKSLHVAMKVLNTLHCNALLTFIMETFWDSNKN